MKRQGLFITIAQLDDLRIELVDTQLDLCNKLGVDEIISYKKKHQVNIINKDGTSDGWEIE